MRNKNLLSKKASQAIINTQNMIDRRDAENIIRDIQRRHYEEGQYTEEEYKTLINFYSNEKKKIFKRSKNNSNKKPNNNKKKVNKKKVNKKKK